MFDKKQFYNSGDFIFVPCYQKMSSYLVLKDKHVFLRYLQKYCLS